MKNKHRTTFHALIGKEELRIIGENYWMIKSETSRLSSFSFLEISQKNQNSLMKSFRHTKISDRKSRRNAVSPGDVIVAGSLIAKSLAAWIFCRATVLPCEILPWVSFAASFFGQVKWLGRVRRIGKWINKSEIIKINKIPSTKLSSG